MEKSFTKWLLLSFLIFIEYCIFRTFLLREIIPYYAFAYDQNSYLGISYQLYEHIVSEGLVKGFLSFPLSPQTFLFPIQATLFFLLFGASRLSALTLNFIYFALLQVIAFKAIKNMTRRYAFSFIFIGMLLAVGSFYTAGGAIDFRIDFIALCLYGILCAAILNSNIFLNKKWTIISAGVAILLISMRFITACYVLGLYFSIVFYYGIQWLLQKKYNNDYANAKKRIKNLGIFISILLVVMLPLFWIHHKPIAAYYIGGHVKGVEKFMRYQQAGLHDSLSNLLYYPLNLLKKQVTFNLLLVMLITFLTLSLLYFDVRRHATKTKQLKIPSSLVYKDNILFLILSVLIPIIILTMDISKSGIVAEIALVPFLFLIICIFAWMYEKIACYSPSKANKAISFFAIFFLMIGLVLFVEHSTKQRGKHHHDTDSLQNISTFINDIGNYANFLKWSTINVASDQLKDYLNAPIASLYYESHGTLFKVAPLCLGGNNGVVTEAKEHAIQDLKNADVYISNLRDYTPDKIFPFERSIQAFRPLLRQIAEKTMIRLGDYYILNSMYRVYVRPDMRITGLENDWITEQGIWIDIPAIVARKINGTAILEGESDFSWLKQKSLKVIAVAQQDGIDMPLNATIYIDKNHYKIICKLPKWNSTEPLSIHLTFSDYFLRPAKHHRIQKLVMQAPNKKYFEKNFAKF